MVDDSKSRKIMTKPLTKEQVQLKKARRIKDKNLRQVLLYRLMNYANLTLKPFLTGVA